MQVLKFNRSENGLKSGFESAILKTESYDYIYVEWMYDADSQKFLVYDKYITSFEAVNMIGEYAGTIEDIVEYLGFDSCDIMDEFADIEELNKYLLTEYSINRIILGEMV